MYHSVTIGTKNMYTDFYMVTDGQVSIAPPSVKTNSVEVPGASGAIDLAESLTNYPLYQNRSGEINFHVLNNKPLSWQQLYNSLMDYLHGKRMKLVLEDDPDYYYEGRYAVGEPSHNNDGTWTDIKILYDIDPYKYYKTPKSYRCVLTGGSHYLDFQDNSVGRMPVVPELVVSSVSSSGLTIVANNAELGISNLTKSITHTGTYKFYDIVLSKIVPTNVCSMNISGTGVVTISFRKGEL